MLLPAPAPRAFPGLALPALPAFVRRRAHGRPLEARPVPTAAATIAKAATPLPASVKLYSVAISLLALLTLVVWQAAGAPAGTAGGVHESVWTFPLVFAGLSALAVVFPIQVTRNYKFTMDIAAHFAALLLFGPVVAMMMAGLGTLIGNLTQLAAGKRGWWGTLFNTGKSMLAVATAGVVCIVLVPGDVTDAIDRGNLASILGLVAGAGAHYLVSEFPIAIAVGLQHRKNPWSIWLKSNRSSALQSAALYLVGLLTALTAHDRPWTLVVMVMPIAPIYITLRRTMQFMERRVEDQTVAAVEAMADTVDMRDRYTYEHSKRVSRYAVQIAEQLGLPAKDVENVRLAARVHDLGKIGVPDHILRKAGPLTAEERELMERHVQIGYDILSRFADFHECKELVLLHHERIDGAGYPNAITGLEDTERGRRLLGAQIIAVADALDAMTSDRPYRRAMSLADALAEFRRYRGVQWLPVVVDALEAIVAVPESQHLLRRARLSVVEPRFVPVAASA